MPGQIRPNQKLVKVLNKILKKPKNLNQKNERQPDDKRREQWQVDSLSIIPQ